MQHSRTVAEDNIITIIYLFMTMYDQLRACLHICFHPINQFIKRKNCSI